MQALSSLTVGSNVAKGVTVVGKRGTTGASTGSHLHFQVTNSSNDTSTIAKAKACCMPTKSWNTYINPVYFFSGKTLTYRFGG
jgi:murein DD-endopeptidase MepM/ murein hydrolase activator NlpD